MTTTTLTKRPLAESTPGDGRDRLYLTVSLVLAGAIGAGLGYNPVVAALLCAGIVVVSAMLFSSRARLLVVFVGGLLVFQSNSEISYAKYAYLALSILAVGLSLVRLARTRSQLLNVFKPLIPASLILVTVILASGVVALGTEVSPAEWLRDASSYMFIALLPAVGLDAAMDTTARQAGVGLVMVAFIASGGHALDWLSRRDASSVDVGRVVLASTSLVALCFSYTLTRAVLGPRRLLWIIASGAIISIMLSSGSRAALLLFVAILGLIGFRNHGRGRLRWVVGIALVVGSITVVVAPIVSNVLTGSPDFFQSRLRAALTVLDGNASSDLSYQVRAHSYEVTRQAFLESPWFGVGPGHTYRGLTSLTTNLDSPWLVPAKLGLVGVAALLAYFGTMVMCVSRLRRLVGDLVLVTAGRGWMLVLLVLVPFGPWIEDAGFALALMIFLTALVATARNKLAETVIDAAQPFGPQQHPNPPAGGLVRIDQSSRASVH